MKSQKPSLAREKPPPGIDTPELALNYVCEAAGWWPQNGHQRQQALAVVAGWFAIGASIDLILVGIRLALERDPQPTRSLKRFDSTIRGKRKDELGGELPATEADVAAITGTIADSLRVN